MPNHTAKPHTCNPIPFNSLCQNDFRNFVKIKYDEGFHKFSDIRRVSNLDVDLAENYGNLVGDESRFSRVITKKKKQLGVVGHGGYPLEYTKIKIWNFESNFLAEQKFYHRNTDSHFDCFLIPNYLEYIHGKISMDGTFHEVKDIQGIAQLYIFNIQLYDPIDASKTHIQPLACFLLPNKSKPTYAKMFRELSEYTLEYTGRPFYPTCFHIDNEATIISLVKHLYPLSEIRTCIYHIFESFRRNLRKNGIAIKSASKTIKNCFYTIKGVCYLDISVPFILEFVLDLLDQMNQTVSNFVENADK